MGAILRLMTTGLNSPEDQSSIVWVGLEPLLMMVKDVASLSFLSSEKLSRLWQSPTLKNKTIIFLKK